MVSRATSKVKSNALRRGRRGMPESTCFTSQGAAHLHKEARVMPSDDELRAAAMAYSKDSDYTSDYDAFLAGCRHVVDQLEDVTRERDEALVEHGKTAALMTSVSRAETWADVSAVVNEWANGREHANGREAARRHTAERAMTDDIEEPKLSATGELMALQDEEITDLRAQLEQVTRERDINVHVLENIKIELRQPGNGSYVEWARRCRDAVDALEGVTRERDALAALLRERERQLDPESITHWDRMQAERDAARDGILAWVVSRWDAEVKNRPVENIYRRILDATWRQVYRYVSGGEELPRPKHDERARKR